MIFVQYDNNIIVRYGRVKEKEQQAIEALWLISLVKLYAPSTSNEYIILLIIIICNKKNNNYGYKF